MEKRVNMKSAFIGMPESSYDVLTFGELAKGDKFIGLPVPGNDHGHGGFRNEHYTFKKIAPRDTNFPELQNNAFRLIDRNLSSFSENTPVIKLGEEKSGAWN